MNDGFVKLMRSKKVFELLKYEHNCYILLSQIALRASREDSLKFKAGEALIGDYKSIGFTEQKYRTAKQKLEKYGFITIKTTNRGTVATLANTDAYDINIQTVTSQLTVKQRTDNEQITTNKKERKKRNISSWVKNDTPTLEEVEIYRVEKNLNRPAKEFLDYWNSVDWIDTKNNKIKNWKNKYTSSDSYYTPKFVSEKTEQEKLYEFKRDKNLDHAKYSFFVQKANLFDRINRGEKIDLEREYANVC